MPILGIVVFYWNISCKAKIKKSIDERVFCVWGCEWHYLNEGFSSILSDCHPLELKDNDSRLLHVSYSYK